MRYLATAALALGTIFSTMTVTATDADARRWHRHHHGGAIALGIAGAVIGGIALSRHRYYNNYYYDDYPYYARRSYYYGGPSYYGRPYYGGRAYYRGGHNHRYIDGRGRGGPAWGMRGKGWSGQRHHH